MDEKKIFIVNLSKGLVGENNANLLGSMIVTKIYLAAMSRADVNPQELKKLPNFYLYADEFQSFANKSFADILSEARKYKLGLNITHQYIEQMAEEVRAAVFGNVGTMIAFRVGSFDAEILEKEFAPVFTMEDIVNLGLYQIYLKLMIDQVASQPFSAVTSPPIPKPEISFRDKVMEVSRKSFARPKAEVEKAIEEWHLSDTPSRRADMPERRENRIPARTAVQSGRQRPEARKENKEIKKTELKIEQKPKENYLAKAIEEAVRQRQVVRKRIEVEAKKETISLNELRHGDKNKSKEPSPENINALKEAIQKAKNLEIKAESVEKKDEKEEVSKLKTQNSRLSSEVPEETLRKILKGE